MAKTDPSEAVTAADDASQPSLPAVDTAAQADGTAVQADGTAVQADGTAVQAKVDEDVQDDIYRVKVEGFEGPLDLLLHLIRKHELDILDIPISFITSKYLQYLALMQELQIDVASEYLVMSATLAYIKSKSLLPPDPSDEADEEGDLEELDPRQELVRRLLEYQKYKSAAADFRHRATLAMDTFERGTSEPVPEGPAPLAPVSMFRLFDAFDRVLKRTNQAADHQVLFEKMSITERVVELTELLHKRRRMRFEQLFLQPDPNKPYSAPSRGDLILTFLALLEMCKMRIARVTQHDSLGDLSVELASKVLGGDDEPADDDLASVFDESSAEAAAPSDEADAGGEADEPLAEAAPSEVEGDAGDGAADEQEAEASGIADEVDSDSGAADEPPVEAAPSSVEADAGDDAADARVRDFRVAAYERLVGSRRLAKQQAFRVAAHETLESSAQASKQRAFRAAAHDRLHERSATPAAEPTPQAEAAPVVELTPDAQPAPIAEPTPEAPKAAPPPVAEPRHEPSAAQHRFRRAAGAWLRRSAAFRARRAFRGAAHQRLCADSDRRRRG